MATRKESRDDIERRHAAELAALEADDDDDDEYEVGFPDGGYIRGRHKRVSAAARARGFKLEPDPEPDGEPGEPGEPGKGDGKVVKPAAFRGGRRVS